MEFLTYPTSVWSNIWADFWKHHALTLNQGRFIRRYHVVFFAVVFFGIGIWIAGNSFTLGVITARIFDALGDLFIDRGFGEL
jgi:hypothetical protein